MEAEQERTHEDHETHKLCVRPLSALASDDIPFLRRTHYHLCRHYLLLVQLMITSQLIHLNAVRAQTLHRQNTLLHTTSISNNYTVC